MYCGARRPQAAHNSAEKPQLRIGFPDRIRAKGFREKYGPAPPHDEAPAACCDGGFEADHSPKAVISGLEAIVSPPVLTPTDTFSPRGSLWNVNSPSLMSTLMW